MFIRFDLIHERDGQTDGQTPGDGNSRAMHSNARQKCHKPGWSGRDVISVFFSGQPQIDVTMLPDELQGKVTTDAAGSVFNKVRGTVDSATVVRKLHGTVYSGAEFDDELGTVVVKSAQGKVGWGPVVDVYCWQSRVRHRGGSGELHSGTGLTASNQSHRVNNAYYLH